MGRLAERTHVNSVVDNDSDLYRNAEASLSARHRVRRQRACHHQRQRRRVHVAVSLLAAIAALHAASHGPRGAAASATGLPSLASTLRSPVAAVGEAVRAYPSIFRTAREKLMLGEPGSAGDLTKTNGLFSVDVHDICPMLTEVTFMSSSVSCLAMSTLEASLRNRRAPGSPLECPDKRETGYGEQVQPSRVSLWDGTPAPTPLQDLRPLPPAFTARRARALMYSEGATWAWHWGVINNVLVFSMCAKGGGGSLDFLVPDGWEPVGPGTGQLPGVYDLIQTDGSPPMPFMALLKTRAPGGGGGSSGSGSGSGAASNAAEAQPAAGNATAGASSGGSGGGSSSSGGGGAGPAAEEGAAALAADATTVGGLLNLIAGNSNGTDGSDADAAEAATTPSDSAEGDSSSSSGSDSGTTTAVFDTALLSTDPSGSLAFDDGSSGSASAFKMLADGTVTAASWDDAWGDGNGGGGAAPPAGLESGRMDGGGGAAEGEGAAGAGEAGPEPHLAVVFRGTNSGPEWMLDFQYHRVANAAFPGPPFKGNRFDGETHAGFTAVFNMVWPHVRAALEREVLAGARARHVTVSGHSLGAAVATLVSFAAQRFLDAHNANVTVGAVLVAAPNVGNREFVEAHAKLVNARRVAFVNDVITMVPCAGGEQGRGMPACNVKATQGGKLTVLADYVTGYGLVQIGAKDMPVQTAAWQNTDRLPLFDAPTADALTGALHVCAYECFFSRWSDPERAAQSSCLLVPPTLKESSGHSYCYGFPTIGFSRQQ